MVAFALVIAALTPIAASDPSPPGRPIPSAGEWRLMETMPGLSQRICQARIEGPELDTMIVLNNRHLPVITVGHPEWDYPMGDIQASYSIDGGAPVQTGASSIGRIVTTGLFDPAVVARLRTAHVMEWTFPFGRFRADMTGFGAALDAIAACERRHASERGAGSRR